MLTPELLTQLATRYKTPYYAYDLKKIKTQFERLTQAFEKQGLSLDLHYSVKANSNLSILKTLRELGARFDVVSGGEIQRCLRVDAKGNEIVFAGVGKTAEEIDLALDHNILQFNVESHSELELIAERAALKKVVAQVALRINPDIDALTHEYITTGTYDSKFGISLEEAAHLYQKYKSHSSLEWVGLDMHIGSQLTDEGPILKALQRFAAFAKSLVDQGISVTNLDFGGGLGIAYKEEKVISPERFAELVKEGLSCLDLSKHKLIMEPGRFLVAEAGVLVTRVQHIKQINRKFFAISDAGMTELMRPSLYGAYHAIKVIASSPSPERSVDIVGPICESSDYFAKDRLLPAPKQGDLLSIQNCGAYASSMGHTYNTRGRPPEILVLEDGSHRVIRRRESFDDLISLEE